jgi:hypothetical protein
MYNRRSSLEKITILVTTPAKECSDNHTGMQCLDKTLLIHN